MNKTDKNINRRQLLKLLGAGAGSALLAACVAPAPAAPAAAPAAPDAAKPAAGAGMNAIGKKLPDDAAPSEQQVLVLTPDSQAQDENTRFMDLLASVYSRGIGGDMFTLPLIRLNKDFVVVPGLAKSWTPNADSTACFCKFKKLIKRKFFIGLKTIVKNSAYTTRFISMFDKEIIIGPCFKFWIE